MKKSNIIIGIILVTVLQVISFSQPKLLMALKNLQPSDSYILSNWNSKNGLPQNTVTSIVQDKDGFIWLGTFDGLARFDGINFKLYSVKEYPELKSNRITLLHLDRQNNLWIVNELGRVVIYNGKVFKDITGKFKNDFLDVFHIAEDGNGNIYLNTFDKLLLYNNGNLRSIDLAGNQSGRDSINFIGIISGDSLLAARGPNVYIIRNGAVISRERFRGNNILGCLKNNNGYWYLSDSQLYYSKTFSGLITPQEVGKKYQFNLIRNGANHLIASFLSGGLYLVKPGWVENIVLPTSFSGSIRTTFQDKEGNIWIGTDISGLYCVRKKFLYALDKSYGITQPNTYPIFKASDGSIWIGQNAGLQRIWRNKIITYHASNGLKNLSIWGIAEDNKKNIWLGANGFGLFKYNGKSFEDYSPKITNLAGHFTYSLFHDSKDRIWSGSANCITKNENGVFTFYNPTPGQKNIFRNFIEDDKGVIWIASEQGLLKLDGEHFSSIILDAGLARALYIDRKKRLWVGTYGNGIWVKEKDKFIPINKKNGLYSDIISAIVEDGKGNFWFTSNSGIFRIREREIDRFFAGKDKFLTSLVYGADQGLETIEFNGGCQPSWARDDEGNLWFPSFGGPVVLDLNAIDDNKAPANVFVENISLEDTTYYNGDDISIPADYSRFTINFSAPSFSSPHNIRFKYKLSGADYKWVDAGNERSITFQKLSYGDYEFSVIATDSYGNWNTTPASIKFRIESRFYKTPLFYLFVLFVVVSAIVLYVYLRLKTAKKIQHRLEEIVTERTSSLMIAKNEAVLLADEEKILRSKTEEENRQKNELLRIVSHDLKNPLSAIQGFVEILLEDGSLSEEDKDIVIMIDEAAQRIKELITQLLNFSRFEGETFTLVKSSINVRNDVDKIVDRFLTVANKKEQSITKNYQINDVLIFVDSILFSQIMENLISNALKYSAAGKEIIVSLSEDEEKAFISVKDFGQGFSEADKHNMFKPFVKLSSQPTAGEQSTGLGLTIVKKFVELNDGSLSLVSQKGVGSEFTIEFNKAKN